MNNLNPQFSNTFKTYWAQNLKLTIILTILLLIQWAIFKVLYPYPSFFSDSYSYIYAAYARMDVNLWPIGYSRFLFLFHKITHSPTALTSFQFLFLGIVSLYLYHTLVFFLHLGKVSRIVIMTILFFDPLNLYLSNFISSDGLFAALSLLWLTESLWIIYRPNFYHLIALTLACFIAFTFRYNAMIYPLISLPMFLFVKHNVSFKLTGAIIGPTLIILFITFSSSAAQKMSGTPQFPPILGGWQWANNALYMREFIVEDSTKFPNAQLAELDRLARDFYREVPLQYRDLPNHVGNFFIQAPYAPLKQYMGLHFGSDNTYGGMAAWAKAAPVFKQYGIYLIKRHPTSYFQHYLLLNTKNYLMPPLEKLSIYNLGEDNISNVGKKWFDYPNNKVNAVSKTVQGDILIAHPLIFLFLNLFFVGQIFFFIKSRAFTRSEQRFRAVIGLLTSLIILNAGFSIFANIICFRYQVFPMIVLTVASLLFAESNQLDISKKFLHGTSNCNNPLL